MRTGSLSTLCTALLLASSFPALASPHIRRGPTALRLNRTHAAKVPVRSAAPRPGMAAERATQIQTALIKAGYLNGAPSGTWDAPSQAAMEKLQGDNGWQTKIVPDSRALIKLGLGGNGGAATAQTVSQTGIPVETPEAANASGVDSASARPGNQ